MKLVSLNYRTATNHSKTSVNRNNRDHLRSFFSSRTETVYYLDSVLSAPGYYNTNARQDLQTYSNAIRKQDMRWTGII